MDELDVRVHRSGREIKVVRRPVHRLPDGDFVTYKRRRYPIVNGDEVHVDGLVSPAQVAVPVESDQVSIAWDEDQQSVIRSPSTARLIVEAGPGTGKTAVACARIAHLVEGGLEPANVWFISFTRTAVAEIRNRIRNLARDAAGVAAVRVSTLDSQVWNLREGFDLQARDSLFSGYDQNISSVLSLLRGADEEMRDYFEAIEHLVVDEAQDLVGARAELIEALIELLDSRCGITIFTDDAQAIYGFSEDAADSNAAAVETLPQRLRRTRSSMFEPRELRTVHRTKSESLTRIFTCTRRVVLDRADSPGERLTAVMRAIRDSADGQVGFVTDQNLSGREDTLVLFRRRAEVLTASNWLSSDGVAHRIRMSGLPSNLHPWIAIVLHDWTEPHLDVGGFRARWDDRVSGVVASGMSAEGAWNALFRVAGERAGRIEIRRLRSTLARHRPPVDLLTPEVGHLGPILGTIHASKGREAPEVRLMLSEARRADIPPEELEEECRVAFVGATRARQTLRVGSGSGGGGSRLQSGRAFRKGRLTASLCAKVELGRDGDVDPVAHAGRGMFSTASEAASAQAVLRQMIGPVTCLTGRANRDAEFRYELSPVDRPERRLGALAPIVNQELFRVGRELGDGKAGYRPGDVIKHLWMIGVRSHVLAEDDPRLLSVHPPYDRTGFWLVPVLLCYPMVYFRRYHTS